MRIGNILEDEACKAVAERLGVEIIRNQRVVADDGIFAATFDALIVGRDDQAIEAKVSSRPSGWGADGGDEIPDRIILQCQAQMLVKPTLSLVWVPAILFDYGPQERLYQVKRNDELIEMIRQRGMEFWENVLAGIPPELAPPPIAALKALHRIPNKTVPLPAEAEAAWLDYRACRDAVTKLQADADTRYAELVAMLGDAEAGTLPTGETITWLLQNSAPSVDYKLWRANDPASYERYVKQGEHRVLRLKKAKGQRS